MDSLTQAALGTAVAYACWHRSLGRRALAWGFAFGTLPDLDIVMVCVQSERNELVKQSGA